MCITNKHKRFFQIAKIVSKKSDFEKYHIGCVAVIGNKVISKASNSNKSHPVQKKYNKYRFNDDKRHTLHAEVKCLLSLIENCVDFSKVHLYIWREHKDGTRALASPCKSCRELIRAVGIKKIYYTGEDSYCMEVLE